MKKLIDILLWAGAVVVGILAIYLFCYIVGTGFTVLGIQDFLPMFFMYHDGIQ